MLTLAGRYIVYDFETTGFNPSEAEPIEIAAIALENGEISDRFSSLIKPQKTIPPHITKLTGIDNQMVENAPAKEKVAKRFKAFIGTSPRIAHNAHFDESFLKAFVKAPPQVDVCDTLELAYFIRPDLPSASLASLIELYRIKNEGQHRALNDVEMTIEVMHRLFSELRANPRQLRAILHPLKDGHWSWKAPLSALLETIDTDQNKERQQNSYIKEFSGEILAIKQDEIDAFFIDGEKQAKLKAIMPDFEVRDQQIEMAARVKRALNVGKHALIEAPTGVGKSLAYLIPLILFAQKNGLTVAISTNTKGLQDQLDRKDLPLLESAMGLTIRWQVVKGRNNYLCLQSWRDLCASLRLSANNEERIALAYLGAIITGKGNGEIAQVRSMMKKNYPSLKRFIEIARGRDCSGKRSHENCPTGKIAKEASVADLVIMNHSLLMTGSQLLPEIDHIVIDEAHALESRASSAFAMEVSSYNLERIISRIGLGLDERGLCRSAYGVMKKGGAHFNDDADLLVLANQQLAGHLAFWEEFISDIVQTQININQNGNAQLHKTIEISLSQLLDKERSRFYQLRDALEETIHALRKAIDRLIRELENINLQPKDSARRRIILRGLADAKFALYEELSVIEELGEEAKRREIRVFSINLDTHRWSIRAEPLVVAEELHDRIFASFRSAIVTSATLSLGDQGGYIAERIGYPDDPAKSLALKRLSAPWDEKLAAVNLIINDMPDLSDSAKRAESFSSIILETASALKGRTLVLFCSALRLEETAKRVRSALKEEGIDLLEQGVDGHVQDLLRKMRKDSGSILFGLQSFWTGIDISGPALSCVIVERIPFLSRNRPIVAAKMNLAGKGYKGFEHFLLPTALLDLRQGVGRLLRRGDDRGIIVLCHENLVNKRYYQRVLDVLPGLESKESSLDDYPNTLKAALQILEYKKP